MFRKLSLLFGLLAPVLLATVACQPVQPVSALKADTARQENQAVVQRFYEGVVNQKDFSVFEEVFDTDMVAHELGFGPALKDTEMLTAFPDLHLTVERWVIEGDMLTAVVTFTATHQAEFMGVAPTGNTVTWSNIDIWHVENGKITEVWHNQASVDILQQIGYQLVPPAE
jgi:predicted ester cyclase